MRWQHPYPPSCLFSTPYASSKVTVLANSLCALLAKLHALCVRDPKTDDVISSAMPISYFMHRFSPRFYASSKVTVLAKLAVRTSRAVARTALPTRCPFPSLCQFSLRSYASSKVSVLAKLAVLPLRAVARTACARSRNRRCHFVSSCPSPSSCQV